MAELWYETGRKFFLQYRRFRENLLPDEIVAHQ